MTIQTPTKTKNNWFTRVDVLYGLVGLVVITQFSVGEAWKSFALGWVIAEVNFELLKRIVMLLFALVKGEQQATGALYGLLLAKFCVWALLFLIISTVDWLQAVPFVLGITTLVIAGLGLGIKEIVYARATRI